MCLKVLKCFDAGNTTTTEENICTYSKPVIASRRLHAAVIGSGITGNAMADPTSKSCSAVLALEMVVGLTSADGSEKSQYRAIVFGGGREIHL